MIYRFADLQLDLGRQALNRDGLELKLPKELPHFGGSG
jgi:hypothetical protein